MIGPKLIGRYKITAELGSGAMGDVYQASDPQTGNPVAIKVLPPHLLAKEDLIERFHREAETLRKLDHPNIVRFIESFEVDSQYAIVMEYVDGGNLSGLLKSGKLPVVQAIQLTLDLSDALIRAHRLNIVHRDIKPDNILLTKDGTPKLADFGVARLLESTRLTQSGTAVGTPYYMSPEAWEGTALDAQADIWSLGVVFFEMLAGDVPFGGDTAATVMKKILTAPPPNLRSLREDLPAGLDQIVSRMLARDLTQRYQTMREVALDLESIQRRGGTPLAVASSTRSDPINATLHATPSPQAQNARLSPGTQSSARRAPMVAVIGAALIGLLAIGALSVFFLARRFLAPAASTAAPSSQATETSGLNDSRTMADPAGNAVEMMLIPDGDFTMGSQVDSAMQVCKKYRSDCDQASYEDEAPPHSVQISAFYIDVYEVTNALYRACVDASACEPPTSTASATREHYFDDKQFDDYPVILVSWEDANKYCEWRGGRLPTEAEWEKAARGADQRVFPWGADIDSTFALFNTPDGDTTKVGSYPSGASSFGLYDMAGNVWEWVADYYSSTYYANSPAVDPMGPDSGTFHVLRGGSWYDSADLVRTTVRLQAPNPEDNNFGFRCAAAPGIVNPSSAILSNARSARDQDGKDQTSIFKGGDTIYIVADLSNAAKGTIVNAKLYGVNLVGVDPNTLLDSKDIVISSDNFSGTIHFDFPVGQGGDWWLGTYTTKIYVDGVLSASVDWGVQ